MWYKYAQAPATQQQANALVDRVADMVFERSPDAQVGVGNDEDGFFIAVDSYGEKPLGDLPREIGGVRLKEFHMPGQRPVLQKEAQRTERVAANVIPTQGIAQQVAGVIYSIITPVTSKYLPNLQALSKQMQEIQQQASASGDDDGSLERQFKRLESKMRRVQDTMEPELNEAMDKAEAAATAEMRALANFPNPPSIQLVVGEKGKYGLYNHEENIVELNIVEMAEGNPGHLAGVLAHELTHWMQYVHDTHGAETSLDKFRDSMMGSEPTLFERLLDPERTEKKLKQQNRIYTNQVSERQAFMQNIIGELPTTAPTGYQDFMNFLNQSEWWQHLQEILYPEGKREIIKALYNYYHGPKGEAQRQAPTPSYVTEAPAPAPESTN